MSYRGLLNQKIKIERSSESISDSREVTANWDTVVAENVHCAITSRSADSRYEDYVMETLFDFLVFLDPKTDIEPAGENGPRDRVTDESGLVYEVVNVIDPTGRDRVKTALVRRIA